MKTERLQLRLQQREFKLKALLEITNAINNNLGTMELLDRFRDIVENQLQIRRAVLFARIHNVWTCPIHFGIDTDYSTIEVESTFGKHREMYVIQGEKNGIFADFDLLIPVLRDDRPLSYILIGDVDDDLSMSPVIKHMRFVQTLSNIISVAIENKFLFDKSLEQERINTELSLAAEMQALMVGSGTRNYDNFEVATFYKPHQEVGGDFCDFIWFNPNEAFLCVADVSGKGVSAAFLMANVQAHMRAILEYTDWTLDKLAHQLNRKVVETVKGDRFVTFFMAYFHRPSRTLHYINAGHNPPVLWDRNSTHVLHSGTVGIGMLPELPFLEKGEITLGHNACIICYTDGVIEIENEAQEEYGYERLEGLMKTACPKLKHPEILIDKIMEEVDCHRGTNPYFDDTALLVCRFK